MQSDFILLLKDIEIVPTEHQLASFEIYSKVLLEWNNKINLTSITEIEDVYIKHFYDSLILSKAIQLRRQTILDVGSGAGFPSIPLKIMFPDLKVTIIDSSGKRIKFLRTLCQELGISVELISGRVEKHNRREFYDIVTARAVAPLNILCELCLPFVKLDGFFLPMKARTLEEELSQSMYAISILGGKIIESVNCDYLNYKRSIIIIKKKSKTLEKYPRDFGKIKKSPLK